PSEKHLWGLKKAVYDTPYLNEVKEYSVEGFKLIENKKIAYEIVLENNEDIQNLFSMTPYYYRTGKIQQERLAVIDKLQTEIEFEILIYMKN
ncbi:MAG: methyltransferase, partial [Ruminococcus sp.]|nr:methyltransferase [Ruminococcus sp.]